MTNKQSMRIPWLLLLLAAVLVILLSMPFPIFPSA